jgi:hypothetical protein
MESTSLKFEEHQRRLVQSASFNNEMYDQLIKSNLYNLMMHRKEAAERIIKEPNDELLEYYEYCNTQISLLLGLPL